MSECVVRMEMPKNNCEMAVEIKGVGDWCPIMAEVCDYYLTKKMPDWCPILCQLPEGHGRLVDKDACAGVLRKLENEAVKPTEKLCFGYAAKMFEEAFTIVPAERSEK